MSPEQRMLIEHQCAKLSLQVALFTDNRDFEQASGCFAEDATFSRPLAPQKVLRGRGAILDSFSQKPAGDSAQHVCTNIVIDVVDADTAKGTTYFTVYAERASTAAGSGAPERLLFVGAYQDRYVRTDSGWRIHSRTGSVRYRSTWFSLPERTS